MTKASPTGPAPALTVQHLLKQAASHVHTLSVHRPPPCLPLAAAVAAVAEPCLPSLSASLQELAAPLSRLTALQDLSLVGLGLTGSLPLEWGAADGLLT